MDVEKVFMWSASVCMWAITIAFVALVVDTIR